MKCSSPSRQMVRSSHSRSALTTRDADAVEAAGHLVGIVVGGVLELPAGVELGHDDLGRRHAFLGVDAGRDAAAIVLDRDRSVGVELDQDAVAMAGERLVDRIVRDLEHHVVEARAVVGVADVHAGALAHRVEALEDLDAVGAIFVLVGVGCHSPDIGICARKSRARACAHARVATNFQRRSGRNRSPSTSSTLLDSAGLRGWRVLGGSGWKRVMASHKSHVGACRTAKFAGRVVRRLIRTNRRARHSMTLVGKSAC